MRRPSARMVERAMSPIMKRQHLLIYAVAAAVLLIGVTTFGSSGSLFAVAFLLLCPLMMIFMMGGMHGGSGHDGDADARRHTDHSTASRASMRDNDPPAEGFAG